MPGSPTSSRVAARREPAELASHWAAAGRKADALARLGGSGARGAGRLRPRRGARASRARARAVGRRAGRIGARADRPRRALHRGRPSWPARPARRRAPWSSRGERSNWSRPAMQCGRHASTAGSASYLHESGRTEAALARVRARGRARPRRAAVRRARASARGTRGRVSCSPGAFDESLPVVGAGARARTRRRGARGGAPSAPRRRQGPGLRRPRRGGPRQCLSRVLELAEETGDARTCSRRTASFTDVLMMLGRPRESAAAGERGLEALRPLRDRQHRARREHHRGAARDRRRGTRPTARARRRSRSVTANFPYMLLMLRADLELGRGELRGCANSPRGRARHAPRRPRVRGSSTSSSRSWRCGSGAGSKRTRLSATPWRGRARARPHSSTSGSAPRDCARMPSWQRSRVPAAMPTLSGLARSRQTTSSTLPGVPRRRRRP